MDGKHISEQDKHRHYGDASLVPPFLKKAILGIKTATADEIIYNNQRFAHLLLQIHNESLQENLVFLKELPSHMKFVYKDKNLIFFLTSMSM